MAHLYRILGFTTCASLVIAMTGCGKLPQPMEAAPTVQQIPAQEASTGVQLRVDLARFVTNNSSQPLNWQLLSGNGSMDGSTYVGTYSQMGSYEVSFRVANQDGNSTDSEFKVVSLAEYMAVVQKGNDLQVLDAGGGTMHSLAVGGALPLAFRELLPDGTLVYERMGGSSIDLFAYDHNTSRRIGGAPGLDTIYDNHTPSGQIFFEEGTASETGLYMWDPKTEAITTVAWRSAMHNRNAFFSPPDLVYFEFGNNGQADVNYWRIGAGGSATAFSSTTSEEIKTVLPEGGVVFASKGVGGEDDLLYYRMGRGLFTVGGDLPPQTQAEDMTYVGHTSESLVIFETGSASRDLWIWSPPGLSTRAAAATAADERYRGLTADDLVVFSVTVAPGNDDLKLFNYSSGASLDVAGSSDNEVFELSLSDSDVIFAVERGTGRELQRFDAATSNVEVIAAAAGEDHYAVAALPNDQVVYSRAGSTGGLMAWSPSTGSSVMVSGPQSTFAGASANGDFVIEVTASGQTDLALWDSSAAQLVDIAQGPADERFEAAFGNGTVIYSVAVPPKISTDLYRWRNGVTKRLTNAGTSHTVVRVLRGSP